MYQSGSREGLLVENRARGGICISSCVKKFSSGVLLDKALLPDVEKLVRMLSLILHYPLWRSSICEMKNLRLSLSRCRLFFYFSLPPSPPPESYNIDNPADHKPLAGQVERDVTPFIVDTY
jgi:hypothetical protein